MSETPQSPSPPRSPSAQDLAPVVGDDAGWGVIVRYAPIALVALGVLLYLPRIGAFGLWDPSEVRVADAGRALLDPNAAQVAKGGMFNLWLIAEGFKLFGMGELGGRLPLALVSILTILATYYAGRAVLRPRAALLGAVAFATMPSVLLGARQLTSAASITLCVTLAVGGLVHLMWPPVGTAALGRVFALVATLFGLAGGLFAAGVLNGVVGPLLGVALALMVVPKARMRGAFIGLLTAAATVAAVIAYLHHGQYSPILGGVARVPQYQTVVTTVARALGFAAMPWLAIAPFAILHGLDGEQPTIADDEPARAPFARALLAAWLVAAYVAATAHDAIVAELLPPAMPVLGLLAGAYLDAALDWAVARPLEGIAIGVLAVVLGHDMLLTTDAFVSVHVTELIRWPAQVLWSADVLFGIFAVFAVLIALAIGAPHAWRLKLGRGSLGPRQVLIAAVLTQLVFGLVVAQWFIPVASKHLSPKDLYGKTKQLDPNAALGQYRFNATGASYYMGGRSATVLNTYTDVLTFLQRSGRVFIFVGSEELAGIDQASRGGATPVPYVVVDDANSRFLILSNRTGPNETDLNPLRRFVSTTAPVPQHPLAINFDDKLQLIGYDLPAEVKRGEDVKVRLHFKVVAPVGGSFKVFLHFDGPGARVNGDHVPLDGRFPTQFWTVGTYVTDEYLLKPDRSTQPSGMFQLYFGLFSGDHRLKVKEGATDGENRVRIGSVKVN